jgi:hypothetical protein
MFPCLGLANVSHRQSCEEYLQTTARDGCQVLVALLFSLPIRASAATNNSITAIKTLAEPQTANKTGEIRRC